MAVGIVLILLICIGIVVLVQIQVRKQYYIDTRLNPEAALQVAARTIGGGEAILDAAGDLSIPLRAGTLSVSATPSASGTQVQMWLSSFPVLGVDGRYVAAYKRRVKKVRRALSAA